MAAKERTYVYSIRDWKEYLGESVLIIFSVLLALILTEYFTSLHEKENTKDIVRNIVVELKHNKKFVEDLNGYNLQVLARIDSVLADKTLQDKIVSNDEFHLKMIAPEGVQFRFLDHDAWDIAKNNNILPKMDVESVSLLTKVYDDQERMSKLEDEVARILLARESRDPKQVRTTLILVRDAYLGWAVDRTPHFLDEIDNAIKKIESK